MSKIPLQIRVGIAAPSLALRIGLRALLDADEKITVIGETGFASEIPGLINEATVLVLAGDISLEAPLTENQALLILAQDADVAIETLNRNNPHTWGLLNLECSAEELITAILSLDQGLLVGDPELFQKAMQRLWGKETSRTITSGLLDPLTDRETQVLQYLAQGLANKQIALALGISEHTVKFHVSGVYTKLGASSRTEAVREGVRKGLVVL